MSDSNSSVTTGPMFSVVIIAYNQEMLIGQTVESVLRQTYRDYELIVVDDGSTDGTMAALASYRDRARIITKDNGGDMSARYAGAALACGAYVVFLDGDDLWFPHTLACYAETIAARGHPPIILGHPKRFRHESELDDVVRTATRTESFAHCYAAYEQCKNCNGGAMAVRRDQWAAYQGATGWGPNFGSDIDLTFRIGARLSPYIHITEPATFGYRNHEAAITASGRKALQGLELLSREARNGRYPMDVVDIRGRAGIMAYLYRDVSMKSLVRGQLSLAWRAYMAGMRYQFRSRHMKYLAAFPIIMLASWLGYEANVLQWYKC